MADRIPTELLGIIEFLHETAKFQVLGVEVNQYRSSKDSEAFISTNLVGAFQTVEVRKRAGTSPKIKWDRDRFINELAKKVSEEVLDWTKDILTETPTLTGRSIEWGTGKEKGSFSGKMTLGHQKLSLFSINTDGSLSVNFGWNAKKLKPIAPELTEQLRMICNARLGTDWSQQTWENGWPEIEISKVIGIRSDLLKDLIKEGMATIRNACASAE